MAEHVCERCGSAGRYCACGGRTYKEHFVTIKCSGCGNNYEVDSFGGGHMRCPKCGGK